MREASAGRMPFMTGWMLAALVAVGGCQSASSFPKSLSSDEKPKSIFANVTWKKAPSVPKAPSAPAVSGAPSTAMAQEQWTNPIKAMEPVKTTDAVKMTSHQEPGKRDWMPPLPEIMNREDSHPSVIMATPPAPPYKHGFRHHQGKAPMPLPNAPSEMSPIPLPAYIIRPADVLTIELLPRFTREKEAIKSEKIGLNQPIYGPHPVHPDGTISLGIYGTLPIAGKTVVQAREEIARVIYARLNPESIKLKDVIDNLRVDIANYNNGHYYVIINYAGAAGIGEIVERFPVTGTETVLDAMTRTKSYGQPNMPGLPGMTAKGRIWVARPNAGHAGPDTILPVDWKGITQLGAMNTNWQIMPGDRIYLEAEPIRKFDNNVAKYLTPVSRILGVAQQINVLRSNNSTNLVAPPLP